MKITTDFYLVLVAASLFIFGWYYVMLYDPVDATPEKPFGAGAENKELFWFCRFYIGNLLVRLFGSTGKTLAKPILTCVVCMAGVYGTIFYFLFSNRDPRLWPVFIVSLAGLNYIIRSIAQME